MTARNAKTLFLSALPLVESVSIREWAKNQTDTWLRMIQSGGMRLAGRTVDTKEALAAYIVAAAIGL